jgi:flagellar FliL protein
MAEDDKEDNEDKEEEKKPTTSKKKLIFFFILVLVLILLSVGGTLVAVKYLMPVPESETDMAMDLSQELDDEGNPLVTEEVVEKKSPAIYYPLKPPLLVNYQSRGKHRYLQAEITVMSRDLKVVKAVETHMPMIRNSLIMVLSGQVYEELQSEEGRELLRQESLMELQKIMEREIGKPGIEKVLFTNLVMQ